MNLSLQQKLRFVFSEIYLVSIVGLMLASGGISCVWYYGFDNILLGENGYQAITGEVVSHEKTNLSIDDKEIWAFNYLFFINDKEYTGTSSSAYSPTQIPVKSEIKILYLSSNPTISYAEGMRSPNIPPKIDWSIFWVSMLLLLGAILFVGYYSWRTLKKIHILQKGVFVKGTYQKKKQLIFSVKRRFLYKMFYSFKINGQLYKNARITSSPGLLKEQELLMYLPENPNNSLFVSTLPNFIIEQLDDVKKHTSQPITQSAPQLDRELSELLKKYPNLQFADRETVVWSGKPIPKIFLRDILERILAIIGGIGFVGGMVYVGSIILPHGVDRGGYILYPGMILFTLLGLFGSVGIFILLKYIRNKTSYILTDRQLITTVGNRCESLDLKTAGEIRKKVWHGDVGNILIGRNDKLEPIDQIDLVYTLMTSVRQHY